MRRPFGKQFSTGPFCARLLRNGRVRGWKPGQGQGTPETLMAAAGGDQQTLGQILFYRQLEPLSLEKHRRLGVSQVTNPFSFLAETHLVPLTVDEFGLAAVCYPI